MSEGSKEIEDSMHELDMVSNRVSDGIEALSMMMSGLKDVIADFKSRTEKIRDDGVSMKERLESCRFAHGDGKDGSASAAASSVPVQKENDTVPAYPSPGAGENPEMPEFDVDAVLGAAEDFRKD